MRVVAIEEHFRAAAATSIPPSGPSSAGATGPTGAMAARLAKVDDLGAGRLADMDAAGIDLQVLSHNVGALESLDGPQAVSLPGGPTTN